MGEDSDEIMLVGLDTNLETDHTLDFVCGEIGKEEIAIIDGILGDISH